MQQGLRLPTSENDPETGLLDLTEKQAKLEDGLQQKQRREIHSQLVKLGIMITMTFLVFLVELFYGYLSNSVALVADAFHMLSDVLALSVALACILVGSSLLFFTF
jgi:zinc transporter 1